MPLAPETLRVTWSRHTTFVVGVPLGPSLWKRKGEKRECPSEEPLGRHLFTLALGSLALSKYLQE